MAQAAAIPTLVALTGPLAGATFTIAGAAASIGRDPQNTITLMDPGISRRHCSLERREDGWWIVDAGSSNGTFVNGVQLTQHRLTNGDRLALGLSLFVYSDAPVVENGAGDFSDGPLATTACIPIEQARFLHPPAGGGGQLVENGLRAVLALSSALYAIRDEAAVYDEVLRAVAALGWHSDAAVIAVSPDGAIRCVARTHPHEPQQAAVNTGLVRQVLEQRAGVIAVPRTAAGGRPADAMLCAPISVGNRVHGVICLWAATGPFTEEQLQLITAVGRLAGAALEHVRALESEQRDAARLQADLALSQSMVGESAGMQRVYDRLSRVARAESSVLIVGETGTGKELAARAIHVNGPRAQRPFVAINCASLTEHLLESELFGHERGAFTGAVSQKKGKIELAHGGTLFLDEVGELALPLQGKLLRVLQEREFERVGGTRTIRVDVRVIAATNADLAQAISDGRFRSDLYFRLNVVTIQMPPLRERPADIPLLARHFLARAAARSGRRLVGFSPRALACLTAHTWPGNVRELENVIERAAVLGTEDEILPEDLPEDLLEAGLPHTAPAESFDYHAAVLTTKRRIIVDAVKKAGGSYVEAARLLRLHPNYLHRLVRVLELKPLIDRGR